MSSGAPYVLIKGGMFYAHNSQGYVHRVELAEIYTKEYAEGHARSCSGEVIAKPATDFLHDTHGIDSIIERLNAMRKAVIAKEGKALKAYMLHHGEPFDGAVLVFAHSFKEAKTVGYRTVRSWTDCEYIDIKGHRIWNDAWLKEHAADQKKLAANEPHVIDNPPTCKGCELWHDELEDSGYCESCAEEREEAA